MILFIEMNLLSCVMPREREEWNMYVFLFICGWNVFQPCCIPTEKNPKHKKNILIKLAGERHIEKESKIRKQQKASVRVKSLYRRYDSYESNKRSTKVRSDRREKAYKTFLIVMVSSLKDSEGVRHSPLQHSTHATHTQKTTFAAGLVRECKESRTETAERSLLCVRRDQVPHLYARVSGLSKYE
mmetsp:Transcript_29264/g.42746  ORF Transcript_29264/g.42746 Transcript_29264/m.42746 type:complete len:185 (-) Transcript_29264:89-643(-)